MNGTKNNCRNEGAPRANLAKLTVAFTKAFISLKITVQSKKTYRDNHIQENSLQGGSSETRQAWKITILQNGNVANNKYSKIHSNGIWAYAGTATLKTGPSPVSLALVLELVSCSWRTNNSTTSEQRNFECPNVQGKDVDQTWGLQNVLY